MAAQTAWSIMIRMTTSSTAPRMFNSLARAAEKASVATEKAEEAVVSYGEAADEAAGQVGVLTAENSALARSFTVAGRASNATNASLIKTGKAANIAHKAIVGIGITSAVVFAIGVKGASNLQGATLQSAIAIGRLGTSLDDTMAKMNDFRQVAISMSSMTGQSVGDSMTVIARMASSGLSAEQIKNDYRSIAQFTDILHFGKDKMSYEEAATLGGGLTHDMRLFDPADSKYGLGRIAQLGYLSPHGTNQLATQVRRMASPLENVLPGSVKSRADQITLLAAWADRMGNLPFAGSAISQMTTQMISPRSARVVKGLEDLGVYSKGHAEGKKYIPGTNNFWDSKTQTFNLIGALKQIQSAVAHGRATGNDAAVKALFSGTQNMQRILMALTSIESLTAYNNIKKQMADMGDDPAKWMDTVQTQLMGTLAGQTGLLISNFTTLSTLLTEQLLPRLTDALKVINGFLGGDPNNPKNRGALGWLADHPAAAKAGGVALLVAGAAGIVALLKGGHNVIRFFALFGKHPHFGTIVSESPRGGSVASGVGEAAADAAKAADLPILIGIIAKFGRLAPLLTRFGSALIPVVGELGLLYTALQVMGAAINWLAYDKLHLPKSERYGGPPESWRGKRVDTGAAPVGLPAVLKPRKKDPAVGTGPWIKSPSIDAAGIKGINVPILPALPPVKPRGRWDHAPEPLGKNPTEHVLKRMRDVVPKPLGKNPTEHVLKRMRDVVPKPLGKNPAPLRVVPITTAPSHAKITAVNAHSQRAAGTQVGVVHHTFAGKIELTGSAVANMTAHDKNELAEMVSEKLAAKITRDTAYAHGGTQTVATDAYGGSDYHSRYGVS